MAEGIITHVKSARKVNKHFICSVCVYNMDALNVLDDKDFDDLRSLLVQRLQYQHQLILSTVVWAQKWPSP